MWHTVLLLTPATYPCGPDNLARVQCGMVKKCERVVPGLRAALPAASVATASRPVAMIAAAAAAATAAVFAMAAVRARAWRGEVAQVMLP
jgi:hypothetical protein